MRKTYHSFEEIERDLKTYSLQRQISLEELKLLKSELKEDLQPNQWVLTLFSAVKKYGIYYLIKRLFK
ncbi:DUF6327 family protein [Aquimarina sp. SS2-1]|uniref:DUF6327 family protein n=1 Tax=Aquimarina besae TaxID=3342247 RepID=UPI00366B6E9E